MNPTDRPPAASLAYLATPYTNFPGGIYDAFTEACALTGKLIQAGVRAYSPIVHGHPITIWGGLDQPLSHAFWLEYDEAMMKVCDVLIVAHMEGWEESKGIAIEIEHFEKAGKPIFDLLDLETLMMAKRTAPGSTGRSKPHEDMTLDELLAEEAHWYWTFNASPSWDAAIYRARCIAWIKRREAEAAEKAST